MNRRDFVVRSSLAAAGLCLAPRVARATSPNGRLNIGVIGTANRAGEDLRHVATENIVALCDVDFQYLTAARRQFPRAAVYSDFRRMLERRDLDAVVVGTPDHTHAVAAVAALQSGRHVYCEKPLARTVSEARRIAEVAKQQNRVTQMGTQIHATENYHKVVKLIQSGVIGKVAEVHVWVGAVYTAGDPPKEHPPVPAGLDWDLWLGPAAQRPYSPEYVPKSWRRWWAFGGGTLSDMGCHYMDLPHWALGLRHPLTVESEGPPVHPEGTPEWLIVRYEYAARGQNPPVRLTWYHGERDGKPVRPGNVAGGELPDWKNGVLFVGEKGMLVSGYWDYLLLPEKDFPQRSNRTARGEDDYETKHHQEWIRAIKNNGVTACNFDYSGALTEAVLLGNVAFRAKSKLNWDAVNLKTPGCAAAEQFIQHHYRPGWII